MIRSRLFAAGAGVCLVLSACHPGADNSETSDLKVAPRILASSDIEAGRYRVMTSGCNDCHTPMYARTNGAEPPESEWLRGSDDPHTGPWGTSYGKNLRLAVAERSEDEWVELLSTGSSLPPMPWPSVRNMSDYDKRALYRYIKSLPGELGQPAPSPLPPGAVPPRS